MPDYNDIADSRQNNRKTKILWVSRFIKLKHPEDIILLAKKLNLDGYDFEIEMLMRIPSKKRNLMT